MVFRVTLSGFSEYVDRISSIRPKLDVLAEWRFLDGEDEEISPSNPPGRKGLRLRSSMVNGKTVGQIMKLAKRVAIDYAVEPFADLYLEAYTQAPKAYDYPYTVELDDCVDAPAEAPFTGKCRRVAVQKERQDYQFGRYQSGLYASYIKISA